VFGKTLIIFFLKSKTGLNLKFPPPPPTPKKKGLMYVSKNWGCISIAGSLPDLFLVSIPNFSNVWGKYKPNLNHWGAKNNVPHRKKKRN